MIKNTRRSISIYYCGNMDNFINDIDTVTYSELKELLSYNGNNVACLLFEEIRVDGRSRIEQMEWVNGNDKEYINKLCRWFECDNVKELEMRVKLKKH